MKLSENKDFYNSIDKIIYWSKLFAVLMIIVGAIMALLALISLVSGASFPRSMDAGNVGAVGAFILLGIYAALYIVPGIWLLNFSSKSRKGLNENDENLFVEGFVNFGKYYKFWGVITVIMLSLYALIFIIGLLQLILS